MIGGNRVNNTEKLQAIIDNMEKVIVGKRAVAQLCVVALVAQGHVLLEDVPGVGKTMMVRTLAKSVSASFKRIQFTPDLLPSDVVGVSIYNPKTMEFQFRPGPIMGNIVLADEINRTSPKTQSALLEGMEEASITMDGETRPIPKPFFVMATQNPIEYEGTYPLPEAQLDRFLLKLRIGYPTHAEEMEVLKRAEQTPPIDTLQAVMSLDELLQLQQAMKNVHVDETLRNYIVDLARRTREDGQVYLGVSPRGSIALMRASQAYAMINGRDFVTPDDVQYLLPYVFGHRMLLRPEAKYEGTTTEEVLARIVSKTNVPIKRFVKQ